MKIEKQNLEKFKGEIVDFKENPGVGVSAKIGNNLIKIGKEGNNIGVKINNKTKGICITSPNNPTGTVLTEKELNSLLNRDIALWERAIKRGKMTLRNNKYQQRMN